MVCQGWADLHIHYWFVSGIKCFKKKSILVNTILLGYFGTIINRIWLNDD